MDNIIIYSNRGSLKSLVEVISFSVVRPYTLIFPPELSDLSEILTNKNKALVILHTDQLTIEEKVKFRHLSFTFKDAKFCLAAGAEHALEAWKMDMFYFIDLPLGTDKLLHTYKKYINAITEPVNELIIRNDGDVLKLAYNNITHLMASGNYTMINLTDGRYYLQTKQLGMFDFLTEKDLNFKRIHRSLIINFKNIRSIGNGKIIFNGSNKEMTISANLENKLKRTLIGKE